MHRWFLAFGKADSRRFDAALAPPTTAFPVYANLAARATLISRCTIPLRSTFAPEPKGFKAIHTPATLDWRQRTVIWHQQDIRVAGSGDYDVVIFPWTCQGS